MREQRQSSTAGSTGIWTSKCGPTLGTTTPLTTGAAAELEHRTLSLRRRLHRFGLARELRARVLDGDPQDLLESR